MPPTRLTSPRLRPRRRAVRGFSLLELVIVMVLIGIIAAIAWPDFQTTSDNERLIESSRRLEALVAMCRAEAMNEARTYRVETLQDGTLRITAQADPLSRPDAFARPALPWLLTEVLLEGVWIESVQLLPTGPAPIRIVNDELEFPETEMELTPVGELESPIALDFPPHGPTPSLRWKLRSASGHSMLVTLDGRLGRVVSERSETTSAADVKRPEPVKDKREILTEAEALKDQSKGPGYQFGEQP